MDRPSRSTAEIADDPERVAALDADLVALAARFDRGSGSLVLDWEYLLFTAPAALTQPRLPPRPRPESRSGRGDMTFSP